MPQAEQLPGRVQFYVGDSREVLKIIPDCSIDSVVTDPPYALTSIVKRFGGDNAAPAQGDVYARASAGFMGKQWDTGETAFAVDFWAEVMRVLKPGGHVIAASGTRTYHRLACAIEDTGFEIRDQILYLYGTGFPKSHSVDRSARGKICSCSPSECDLRSVSEPDVSPAVDSQGERGEVLLASMPEQSASVEGRSKLSGAKVRGRKSGVEGRSDAKANTRKLSRGSLRQGVAGDAADGADGRVCDRASRDYGDDDRPNPQASGSCASSGPLPGEQRSGEPGTVAVQPKSQAGGAWPICNRCLLPRVAAGLGTALKPACEPWVLARKPLREKTVAANVLAHGTGAINIDGCRVGAGAGGERIGEDSADRRYADRGSTNFARTPGPRGGDAKGRFPANVIHDGSDEVVAAFPDSNGQQGDLNGQSKDRKSQGIYGDMGAARTFPARHDRGSAARFFYSAKADAMDRVGSKHPTVKPVDLMQYLCRLITPPGGVVLDPFAGSGSTGEATFREGFSAILVEREEEYAADIRRRMMIATGGGGLKEVEISRARHGDSPPRGPLFDYLEQSK